MKYLIVKKGYEYNDEFNILNEDGYTIESKLFSSIEEAKNIGLKAAILEEFKDWKGNFDSSSFDFHQFDYEFPEELAEYFKGKGYPVDEDDYQMFLPKDLSEQEILEAWEHYNVDLFQIKEVQE